MTTFKMKPPTIAPDWWGSNVKWTPQRNGPVLPVRGKAFDAGENECSGCVSGYVNPNQYFAKPAREVRTGGCVDVPRYGWGSMVKMKPNGSEPY